MMEETVEASPIPEELLEPACMEPPSRSAASGKRIDGGRNVEAGPLESDDGDIVNWVLQRKCKSFTQVSGQTIRTGILKLALYALSRGWKCSIMRRF